jgi:mono/diheme cytochrome c family protein
MKSIVKWTGIVLGALFGLALLAGLALSRSGKEELIRTYPDIPVEMVHIPTDPEAIARGRHVAVIWTCTKCHGEDLSGTLLADDPFLGTIPATNLTSGQGGIGRSYSDADWIRAIRHGVKADSRGVIYMYDYSTMSDQDLGDLIAYLKHVPPVDTDYPAMRLGPIAAMAPAVGLFTPVADQMDHAAPRPADPAPGATIEYGRYLSAICFECHSPRLGDKLGNWTQADFVRAVRTSVLPNGQHLSAAMSPSTFGEMNDTELAALWLYFRDGRP